MCWNSSNQYFWIHTRWGGSKNYLDHSKTNSAFDCNHDIVHYDGVLNGLNGIVEHWACCNCHHAWADSELNREITDNTSIRDKLNVTFDIGFDVNWNPGFTVPVYSQHREYGYKNYLEKFNLDAYNAIETNNTNFMLDSSTSNGYFGKITNHTSNKIRVDVHTRAWGARPDSFELGIGESRSFKVTVDQWNAEKSGENYGFALLCYNLGQQNNGDYILLSHGSYEFSGNSLFEQMQNSSDGWRTLQHQFDEIKGDVIYSPLVEKTELDVDTPKNNHYIIGRKKIDESKYSGVYFDLYNGSNIDTTGRIWNEDWKNYCDLLEIKMGQWNEIFVPINVWNGAESMLGFYDMGLSSGYLLFGNFRLAEK